MKLFDIIGPVMVGPSSSHTAGAVKIGYVAGKLLDEPLKHAEILLYGSFLATGKGHGTDLALVAGLLGMKSDDRRIPESIKLANEQGVELEFGRADIREGHPNSVLLKLDGVKGRHIEVIGESLGGSLINISKINGLSANFSGDYPTLIIHNQDQPGCVSRVTNKLMDLDINIASMQLYRAQRGGHAVMIIEVDSEVSVEMVEQLRHLDGIENVTYYSLL